MCPIPLFARQLLTAWRSVRHRVSHPFTANAGVFFDARRWFDVDATHLDWRSRGSLDIALTYPPLENQVVSIGGPEYLSLRQMVDVLMTTLRLKRWIIHMPLGNLKILALILDQWRGFPMPIYWLDYLSTDRTTSLENLPRIFGIIPARFHQQVGFLSRLKKSSPERLGVQEA